MIIRTRKNKNYTVMSNTALQDPNLSLKAKGLWAHVMCQADVWNFSGRSLEKILKESRPTINGILKELEDAGYLVRGTVVNNNGKFVQGENILHEEPWTKNVSTVNLSTKQVLINNNKTVDKSTEPPKQKNEVNKLFYLVVKKYQLPVVNHSHVAKWVKDLEVTLGAETAELYLNRLLERDINAEALSDRFVPQITKPIDILNKSQQIIIHLRRTRNTAPAPDVENSNKERERIQSEEAQRIRDL